MAAVGSSKIFRSGTAHVRGQLRDARPFARTTALAKNGDCPFYLSFSGGSEVVLGWLNFPVGQPAASGTVVWVKAGTNSFAATLQAASVQTPAGQTAKVLVREKTRRMEL